MLKKLFYGVLIGGSLLIASVRPSFAEWKMDDSGNLVYSKPQVLGDEDEKKQEETNENRTDNQSATESKKEDDKQLVEQQKEREREKEKEANQVRERTEIKNNEIKSINIDRKEDNQIRLKIETKKQENIESVQDKFEIEDKNKSDEPDGLEDDKIKISTGEGKGEFEIEKNKIKVKTNFPLSINPETKALMVTTPAGEKTVTVLPDKVAMIVKELGVVDDTGSSSNIEMETNKEKLVYKFKGKKKEKLFGVMPVEVEKEIVMSAETGQLVDTNQSLISKLIDAFSF